MSYRLVAAAGRLATASKNMMNGSGRAGFSTKKYAPLSRSLAEKMQHFQIPNDLPVHIKGGPVDMILLYITGFICTVGVIDCFRVYYQLAYPKK
ncbi:cytochrome c oxidase subunit 7A1, mitochondrial-like isoform X2 [Portunus trituberculatus]|uniref:cytochrome c oxidase subunit 7A1, mitochondrial-like isoform X2 n=1 Tax=Portunus trituberculatus TaxID=210409 RepID=UPI001E1CE609|nr:cytochrome c oxidase subunit 7A1, mitochondrial-like isoform X2 [Portunus trituberculatus]